MTTYTYNRENWSGETSTVKVFANGTFKDSVFGKGKWTHEDLGDGYEVMRIKIDGVPFRAIKFDNAPWYAESYDISRDGETGIIACLKLASNTM
jgi:hypothetical protein